MQGKLKKRGKEHQSNWGDFPAPRKAVKQNQLGKKPKTIQALLDIFGSQFLPEKGKFNTGIREKVEESAKQAQVGS